ncbi:hypothetical protein O6H91_01G037800 [Diphasiastrum complanatum]|nr:hypothetical protein O6H91_01G037800 [Diphasiastrum complanatum]
MQNRQQLRDIIKQSISRKEDKWNRIVDDVFHKNGFKMERELEYLFHHLCYVKQSSSPEFLIVFEAMMIIVTSLAKFGLGLVSFLFKLQDGGGMTPLHAAVSTHDSQTVSAVLSMLNHISLEPDQNHTDQQLQLVMKDCVNAVDGAGRTPLHRAIAQHSGAEGSFDTFMVVESLVRDKRTDLNAFFKPILTRPAGDKDILCHFDGTFSPHSKLLNALFTDQTPLVSLRCMMLDEKWQDTTALQLAVLHNLPRCVELLLAEEKGDRLDVSPLAVRAVNFGAEKGRRLVRWTLLQLAAAMGNEAILQMLLPHVDKIYDVGKLQNTSRRSSLEEFSQPFSTLPALHLAAGSGNPEAVRMILETRKFDPIVTDSHYGSTPLHWAVNAALIEEDFRGLEDFVDVQGLQSAYKLRRSRPTPIGYSGKKGCVNLLLQAGLDIWHCDKEGKIPNPGSNALEDSRTWWYEKLDAVTKDTNNNLTLAANAISVTAALVATASFVGPLQPPLGYETTYIHYELFLVKVFIICVSLSFYFAVAAIMISVIPSLPLPHAPLQVELQRTQRLVLAGVCLLLVSILCVLASFAASTIVVLPKKSGHRLLTMITAMVGELTCLVVFLLFVFRLVRLVYYKNDHVRRFYDGMVRLKWHGL